MKDNKLSTALDDRLIKIKKGLKINNMQMKDGVTGEVFWECGNWDLNSANHTANISKKLLESKVVIRNVNFSSEEKIENLELLQNFYLLGDILESCRFKFGFVIPGSTNDWEQIIEAREEGVLPAEVLSGKLHVETFFLCEGQVLWKNRITIFYV